MAIAASQIKELREISGAGMVDCKNALTKSGGDIDKAVELLREAGVAKAAKKSGRIASEGMCYAYIAPAGKTAVLLEINSETDFVAKNQDFRDFVISVARQAAQSQAADVEGLFAEKWVNNAGLTVRDALNEKISVTGENISIRRFERFSAGESSVFSAYVHGGGRVAVILELTAGAVNDTVTETGADICMQIAAMSPQFVNRADISDEFIEKEREILTQLTINEGKPKDVAAKIVEGRLNKELKNYCLMEQEFVKSANETVAAYVKRQSAAAASDIGVLRFARYETGEGLQKREENFAEEVSKAAQG